MRETQWPPARGRAGLLIDRPRLQARALEELGQTLISGDLEAAVTALAPRAPILGLHPLAPEGAHALRIGRASALLVTPAPLVGRSEERPSFDGLATDGWRDGWCATSVDDGWAAVEVSGADAPQALMQATSADLGAGSPSAAVVVFGLRGLLARMQAGFRLHVEAPWLETLLTWLDGV
jgi:sarcosine oxidase, subunit gamma